MRTDYKFWYIKRDDDGLITEVAIRYYEGEYQTVDDKEVYVRTKRLQTADDLSYLKDTQNTVKGLKEDNGNIAVYYTSDDFGKIKTDDELRSFLNKQLAKDNTRIPIPEQTLK